MKRKLPPLSAVVAFEAAARHGRLTLAAAELSVTPGAISRQVKNLENWLGCPLFEGTKNNPVLTDTARGLLPQLRLALDQVEAAASAVLQRSSQTVVLACYNTFAAKWLLPRLHVLHRQHPQLNVQLATHADLDNPQMPRADVVIRAQVVGQALPAGWQATLLFSEWIGPVMSHQAGVPPVQAVADLARWPRLSAANRTDAWAVWAAASQIVLPPMAINQVYEHYYVTLEAAQKGLGICVAPWHLVADDLAAGRLEAPFKFVPSGFHYLSICRPDSRLSVMQVYAWLKQEAGTQLVAQLHAQQALG
jgi:LysR family transcriptional regulator, glycine cleavage system transcriptional activator